MGIEYACRESWVLYYHSYLIKSFSEKVHYAYNTIYIYI